MFDTKCCVKKENLVEKIAFVFKLYSIETNRAKPQNSIPLDVEKHENNPTSKYKKSEKLIWIIRLYTIKIV